jgi:hypothetical protein
MADSERLAGRVHQEYSMSLAIRQHAFAATLALIAFFAFLPFLETIMRGIDRHTSAIEWHGVEVVTKTVRPGDFLEIVYGATVNKQCPADLRGFLVAEDGTVPVRYPVVAGGYSRPSDEPVEIRVRVKVPETADPGLAPLHDGEYIYRTLATRYCPDGVQDDTGIPDARFNLEVEP